MLDTETSRWAPALRSVLRIVAAAVFMQHGAQKLFGVLGAEQTAALFSQMGLAGILEFFGGGLLLLGLGTRVVAFILSGEMAVAYFQAHAPRGFWPILNRGELPVVLSFLFLYFAAAGPGPWSLDALRRGRRGEQQATVRPAA